MASTRIQKFIKEVVTVYSSLSEEKLNQMWEALDDHTCQYIIKSGSRKGQHCGVPENECKTHSSDAVIKTDTQCQAIVKSGKVCGSKTKNSAFCGKHVPKSNEKESESKSTLDDSKSNESDPKPTLDNSKSNESKPTKTTMTTCGFIMKAGDRKGQACGKNTKEKFCSLHRPKETIKKDTKESKPCALTLKTGERKGEVCGNTTQSCPHHQPLRIKKWGEYSMLSGTAILFDKTTQSVIGYIHNEHAVFEENDDVRKASLMYDLAFVARV
jgi:hypothetical protein